MDKEKEDCIEGLKRAFQLDKFLNVSILSGEMMQL